MSRAAPAFDAVTTARRVLSWAAEPTGLPPTGQLLGARALAAPGRAAVDDLRALAHAHTGRQAVGVPPLGDPSPIGLGALLFAAAIGGRDQPREAGKLAEALPAARLDHSTEAGWADALARHAVVGPFVAHPAAGRPPPVAPAGAEPATSPAEPLREVLLRESPLSGVLHRPSAERLAADGAPAVEIATMSALAGRPRGGQLLAAALAGFSTDHQVLEWRARLLRLLATTGHRPDVAAEAYWLARARHGAAWDAALHRTREAFTSITSAPDELAFAVGRYWLPLVDMRALAEVRARDGLLRSARPAMDFAGVRRQLLTPVEAA